MMVINALKRAETLPGLSLYLYEQLAHISRGPTDYLMDNLARISGKVLRPKSR
jgi:hypothetical protein